VFPTHAQIAEYLQTYADDVDLTRHISFSTRVTAVYHTPGNTEAVHNWTVESVHTSADGTTTPGSETVSHVIVSNGHYNEPFIPPIPGLNAWRGQILHSRWWRNPMGMRGRTVVVVGSRASGSDIARELAIDDSENEENAKRTIYHSVRGLKPGEPVWDADFPWAKHISVVPEIERAEDGVTLHLVDGTVLSGVDAIVFATGYLYSYPFFPDDKAPWDKHPVTTALAPAADGLPRAGGQDIRNLNTSDTFYAPDPTLSLIGLREYEVQPGLTVDKAEDDKVAKADLTCRLHRQPLPSRRGVRAPHRARVQPFPHPPSTAPPARDRQPARPHCRVSGRV
jgi:hypothetical protein